MRAWHEEDNLSLVVVRHPMARLVSAYFNKFVLEMQWKQPWARVGGHLA